MSPLIGWRGRPVKFRVPAAMQMYPVMRISHVMPSYPDVLYALGILVSFQAALLILSNLFGDVDFKMFRVDIGLLGPDSFCNCCLCFLNILAVTTLDVVVQWTPFGSALRISGVSEVFVIAGLRANITLGVATTCFGAPHLVAPFRLDKGGFAYVSLVSYLCRLSSDARTVRSLASPKVNMTYTYCTNGSKHWTSLPQSVFGQNDACPGSLHRMFWEHEIPSRRVCS